MKIIVGIIAVVAVCVVVFAGILILKFLRAGKEVAKLQAQVERELREEGVPATATILSARPHQEAESFVSFFLELEVVTEGGTSYRIRKHRPWSVETLHDWIIEKPHASEIREGASLPVRVHPRVREVIDFEFNMRPD